MISRRRFTTGVVIALTPLGATASAQEYKAQQPGQTHHLGILHNTVWVPSDPVSLGNLIPKLLRELGYVEGQNLRVEQKFAEGRFDRLPGLARDHGSEETASRARVPHVGSSCPYSGSTPMM